MMMSLGQLEAMGDEVTFIQSVRAEQFDRVDFTFFASAGACTRKNWSIAQRAGSAIVDLSYALEDEAGAALRSTWIERELGRGQQLELQPSPVVVAHPAAVVLALLVLRAQKAGKVQRVVATIFEPASEHRRPGLDELHQPTVHLLSLQQLPTATYDTSAAFTTSARRVESALR